VNILVVGGAGYIGSHMVKYLQDENAGTVTVLDNLAKGHRAAVSGAELVVGDYGNGALVAELCSNNNIDALMHFGADSLVGESVTNPAKYYENNVVKGKTLIDGALEAGVKHVIFSSTAATYGEPTEVPITEDAANRPTNPYGRSKLAFEGLLESYRVAYGLNYTILRYFNAAGAAPGGEIGEDHSPETHIIPLVLQVTLGQRESINIYGSDYPTPDGTCVRDYVHVNDLASAHLLALRRIMDGGSSEIFNLGNGTGFSVREIVDYCRQVTGHAIPEVLVERRAGDPAVLIASSKRAQSMLNWQPKYTAVRYIISTAWAWHSTHPQGYGDN